MIEQIEGIDTYIDVDTGDVFLATEEMVQKRIAELAHEVITRYKDIDPLFVCLLRGGVQFTSMLMFKVHELDPEFNPKVDYMIVGTYGKNREPGPPRVVTDIDPAVEIKGRHLVFLDDVLDTGTTAAFVRDLFLKRGAAAVDLITLVQKENPRTLYPFATIFGFRSPRRLWLEGMGMDNAKIGDEAQRWLAAIIIANTEELDLAMV